MRIKDPAPNIFAKTTILNGKNIKSFSVFSHCMIVGIIAQKLIKYIEKRKGFDFVKEYDLNAFPIFCARHDIGKASPGFQYMLDMNTEIDPKYKSIKEIDEHFVRNHEQISAEYLRHSEDGEYIENNAAFIIALLRWHHGANRGSERFSWEDDYIPTAYGNNEWNVIRNNIDHELVKFFGDGHDFIKSFKKYKISNNELIAINNPPVKYLCGLLSTCDWIGSDEDNFNYLTYNNSEIDTNLISKRAKEIIEKIGLDFLFNNSNLKFGEIFKDSCGIEYTPNWIQTNLSKSIDEAGVYVVEANMGEGKTEAALYAAYSAINKGIINGIYFGLPTQVTSNSIFERYSNFLINSKYPDNARLIHGKASFSEQMASRPSWFSGNKKGILAQFGIGTIDQAIISVMGGIKYFYIRTFGLANKCIIIDEVHSYDIYTSELIIEMIKQLLELKCVIIILSATLTSKMRAKLCGINSNEIINAYPLITKFAQNGIEYKHSNINPINKKIIIRHVEVGTGGGFGRVDCFMKGRDDLIKEAYIRASNGEIILWIENTRSEAQRVYSQFHSNDFEVGILHSSYTYRDRQNNETKWINKLGKNGDRSKGAILISTQVCEQSVDIDADLLITALCPSDMLFQRMGRLHRHLRNARKNTPECILMDMPEYGEVEYNNIGKKNISQEYSNRCGVSTLVYEAITLRKTHEVFKNINEINLPGDIRKLIEKTYDTSNDQNVISKALIASYNEMKISMQNEATKAKARSSGNQNDNIDGFSDEVEIDQTLRNTRLNNRITMDVVICSSIENSNHPKFITIYGYSIDLTTKLTNTDYYNINEAQLKIDEKIITKFPNVFAKFEINKKRFIALIIKNGIAVDYTNGRLVSSITYDVKGLKCN